MVIDSKLIENGISVELIAKLIDKHRNLYERYNKLQKYYNGDHAIMHRVKVSNGTANNKIVCNHAKYITDVTSSYIIGNPVSYSASEGYDIEALKNSYLVQDIASLDFELVKGMSIYGRAYELIYANDNSEPVSCTIDPHSAFVVYDNSCNNIPLFGVYYYTRYDIDGNVIGISATVYTKDRIYSYSGRNDNYYNLTLDTEIPHYFGAVPLIEYRNNGECQGDFEQSISLIDAYNTLMSDRVNDKEQFVDAFLFLRGIEIDSEEAKKLKEEKILMGYDGASAEYLSKVMTESDIEVLRNNLEEDIHHFSMVPNLSDDEFGNNLSGVAIKYKLMCFEQMAKNKERYFAKGLKQRFAIYNAFLAIKGVMGTVPVHRVDFIFKRNLPANNLENAQMISYLAGLVTNETLLSQLDFVGDPKEEAELVKSEQLTQTVNTAKAVNASYREPEYE